MLDVDADLATDPANGSDDPRPEKEGGNAGTRPSLLALTTLARPPFWTRACLQAQLRCAS